MSISLTLNQNNGRERNRDSLLVTAEMAAFLRVLRGNSRLTIKELASDAKVSESTFQRILASVGQRFDRPSVCSVLRVLGTTYDRLQQSQGMIPGGDVTQLRPSSIGSLWSLDFLRTLEPNKHLRNILGTLDEQDRILLRAKVHFYAMWQYEHPFPPAQHKPGWELIFRTDLYIDTIEYLKELSQEELILRLLTAKDTLVTCLDFRRAIEVHYLEFEQMYCLHHRLLRLENREYNRDLDGAIIGYRLAYEDYLLKRTNIRDGVALPKGPRPSDKSSREKLLEAYVF